MAFLPLATSKKFPFKCHEMLHYAEKRGLDDIVSWLPGGKGFRVHNHELFCKKVLKATFNHSNYKSFEKQLNNWGFQRDATGTGRSYSNSNFVRGRKSLCQEMSSKSTRTRGKPSEGATEKGPASSVGRPTDGPAPAVNAPLNLDLAAALLAAQAYAATQANVPSATSNLGTRGTLLDVRALLTAAAAAGASSASSAAPGLGDNSSGGLSAATLWNLVRNHRAGAALGLPTQQLNKDRALVAALAASAGSPPELSAEEIEMVWGQRRLRLQRQALLEQLEARQQEMALHRLVAAQKQKTALLLLARAEREQEHDRAAALLSLRNSPAATPAGPSETAPLLR